MLEFDFESAAVARFLLSNMGDVFACYGNMPQDFSRPCVFFPPPQINTAAGSLSSYVMRFSWAILFFDETAQAAYAKAAVIAEKFKKCRNLLPIYNEKGEDSGGYLRLKDCAVSKRDGGEAELLIKWDSFRRFDEVVEEKILFHDVNLNIKN